MDKYFPDNKEAEPAVDVTDLYGYANDLLSLSRSVTYY